MFIIVLYLDWKNKGYVYDSLEGLKKSKIITNANDSLEGEGLKNV